MTVLENMQAVLLSLPKNERKAAEYLLNYPHDIQRRSAELIAQDAGLSLIHILISTPRMNFSERAT